MSSDDEEMRQLPGGEMPVGIVLEKPARNLAALAATEALTQMRAEVLSQWKHQGTFAKLARHSIRPIDRLLFYGPPGNGKTMAAQWLAEQLKAKLFRVRTDALVGQYLGQTQGRIGKIMGWLEKQSKCVVLFDEVEMLFPSRKHATGNCDRELQSAMGVFWQFLDRWEAPTVFVLATNLRERLDEALLSRIELQMEFGPPTPEQARGVAHYWAEVLHEYGGEVWGPVLAEQKWENFRSLFQAVVNSVRKFVAEGA